MSPAHRNPARRQQILETLALMLEENPGGRITTAQLAGKVGVSEAALYRHFPSKTRMFEDLIAFIEDSVFSRMTRILEEESDTPQRLHAISVLLLTFAERNPGISRLLVGEALAGEDARLQARVNQLHDRLELSLRQVFKDAEMQQGLRTRQPSPVAANLLLATILGRVLRFVQSSFRDKPTHHWGDQWVLLMEGLFRPAGG